MKKLLLVALASALSTAAAHADGTVYTYLNDYGFLHYGSISNVSPNGKWAVGADNDDQSGSYFIDTATPDEFTHVTNGELYDVANNGMACGSVYDNQGTETSPVYYYYAATYENGQWIQLPIPSTQVGQSYARAMNADGTIIAGMAFCMDKEADLKGKYYPVLWTWNDDLGDYEVTAYTNLDLPANLGMDINDVSEDGKILVGKLRTFAGSEIPAMVVNGELKIWNNLEVKLWPWFIEGEIQYDPYGEPYMFETGFVDGIQDGAEDGSWFQGGFNHIRGDYVFGSRSLVESCNPTTGEGTTVHCRCIYNIKTGEFIDQPSPYIFSCGFGPDKAFSYLIDSSYNFVATQVDGNKEDTINKLYNLTNPTGDDMPALIYNTSDDGNILAGSTVWFNDAIGEFCESPILVIIDSTDGVNDVIADTTAQDKDNAVYDLHGRRILEDASGINNLPAGIYIHSGKKLVK